MKFAQIVLNATSVEETSRFYTDLLGMTSQTHGIGYGASQAHLDFKPGQFQTSSSDSFFWKIGITVGNLEHAVSFLHSQGIEVSNPHQFQNIGYLAHLADPSGNTIELLQQGFEGNHRPIVQGHPIGSQAIVAHITVRVRDLAAAQKWAYQQSLRLLSIQPVNSHGFTLYFYAWSEETLPLPDIEAVENREWLWRRPYTLLELQHIHKSGPPPVLTAHDVEVKIANGGGICTLDLGKLNV